ncbi:magnesium chelatase subunit D [Maricaulaceae bacterium EIL42A08]|nr:magnesium chelatase subunit D [Maricaulaceae bacterium EIL42A08]
MSEGDHTHGPWADARLVAGLLAIDPGLGGAVLTARAGPVRNAWLHLYHAILNDDVVWRRIPPGVSDEALLGGIDLAATLKSGKAVERAGLLETIGTGVGVLPMAERAEAGLAGRLAVALDSPKPPVIVALDESAEPDEVVPEALSERLAFHIDLSSVALADLKFGGLELDPEILAMARMHLPHVLNGGAERALTAAALALGIDSLRAPIFALRAARAAAALDGRDEISADDVSLVARLILAPRATRLPTAEEEDQPEPEAPDEAEGAARADTPEGDSDDAPAPDDLTEITTEAAKTAIPPGLLAKLAAGASAPKSRGAGKAGAVQKDGVRGRPAGTRRGDVGQGRRLDVLATLRAAAPWGKARRKGLARFKPGPSVEVRTEDFRIKRFKQKAETETIFVVDASGSLALNRLAEAKGAVELMLAESYVRRDQVAVIAFRGKGAEMLLPPTRSLTRAKRSLAALPGGGGTPLAAAIDAAEAAAHAAKRQGRSVTLVFLTDGAANITREGEAGRERALAEARQAARQLRAAGHAAILVDVSKRGAEAARDMATDMGARYARLPNNNPGALADLALGAAA